MSFSEFLTFFDYPFVWYALVVGTLIALCSSLLGVTLVLKRFSFIGDGLSHVAFGAMAVAAVAGLTNQMIIILPVTIAAAVLLLCTSGRKTKLNGDASLAMISVSALALGYLIYNLSDSPNVSGDVCTTLFGSTSILALTQTDLWICIVMSVAVTVLYILFYHKIFAITFDETFAKATGVKTGIYNLLIAVIIVLAMNLVGSLLISALVIFPALCGMRLFRSFKGVVISSACVSVLCALIGILASIWLMTPTGSTIVAVDLIAFLIFSAAGFAARRARRA